MDNELEKVIIRPDDINQDEPECCYCKGQKTAFGKLISKEGFEICDGYWKIYSRITFAVKCRRIRIMYAKFVGSGGKFSVFVDGINVAMINSGFYDGDSDCIEAEEVFSSTEMAEHIIEVIVDKDVARGGGRVWISAVELA